MAETKKPVGKTVPKAAAKTGGKPSAVNKSEEIRKVAKAMKEKREKPRPVAIIAALKKQGITVSSPQVSMVLKRMGFRPARRRRGASSRKPAGTVRATAVRSSNVSVDDLIAAKRVASQFGNADKAIAALSALKKFES